MVLERLPYDLTVCKAAGIADLNLEAEFFFLGKTDEELSLVCRTEDAPAHTLEREDGWRGFRVQGTLDFSLTGILSQLSGILAEQGIGIFAVSTYNTDYLLFREAFMDTALDALKKAGYEIKYP